MMHWFRDWLLGDVLLMFAQINHKMDSINERIIEMSAANDLLVTEVAKLTTAVDSAVALLNGIVAQYKDCATMAQVEAVTADIEKNVQALADATAANTPG